MGLTDGVLSWSAAELLRKDTLPRAGELKGGLCQIINKLMSYTTKTRKHSIFGNGIQGLVIFSLETKGKGQGKQNALTDSIIGEIMIRALEVGSSTISPGLST